MKKTKENKIIALLGGIHDSYKTIRGNILMMNPTPNLDRVYQLLVQEEQLRTISTTTSTTSIESMTLVVQKNAPYKSTTTSDDKKTPYYTSCKWKEHSVDSCYYIHGFPKGHPLDGKMIRRQEDWQDDQCDGQRDDRRDESWDCHCYYRWQDSYNKSNNRLDQHSNYLSNSDDDCSTKTTVAKTMQHDLISTLTQQLSHIGAGAP